ncbi:hypothetical protein PVAP13_7NG160917 [Panicum virgatum]|uniref:Uncharacterized protein n=1 Tax=Panicum virgatum TaxID=38727 RepID=A0A8T0PZY5_PANVG|nr:hypothetical protein PVAP13_7NG160917 [Panicum virgatum]
MTILVITVDLQCCRCRAKITRDFCIEKVEFEDKLNKVIVRGKFSGEKLSKKICYKADRIVKDITIDRRETSSGHLTSSLVHRTPNAPMPFLRPSVQPSWACAYPPPRPWCPCPPHQACHCSKPPPPPPPRPPPCSCSKDDGCSCGGDKPRPPCHHCGGRPPWPPCSCGARPLICWTTPPPGTCPPWWCDMVTEENPGCSIM